MDTPTILTVEQRLQAQFERLESQFLLLKEQTRQAQQLAALGTAAAMIAHEYNNLMTPVLARARHAIDSGDTGLMVKALELTLKQADIMTAMSDRVLGLAGDESPGGRRIKLESLRMIGITPVSRMAFKVLVELMFSCNWCVKA